MEIEKSLQHFRERLGLPLSYCVESTPLPAYQLFPGEKKRLAEITHDGRRDDWLRGRRALKNLLADLGKSLDTTLVAFPNETFSLSHSAGHAIAVYCANGQGIGVDLEPLRPLSEGTLRHFATDEEKTWVLAGTRSDERAIKLWVIKEAIFKADLHNTRQTLNRYGTIGDLDEEVGAAKHVHHDFVCRYSVAKIEDGFLALATASV